ncbi:hypothetical protein M8C21_029750 [Ambrosia artemisiifolia]|uniref:UBC core domain-containing protein n=1 Tax=Ambrosia artemisiifolia TaxID=4212 RepID=A0AAD5C4X9_AMBAR|nr:hypothetical protein M8C21_029750 [Ambrosia artemisiifolia]
MMQDYKVETIDDSVKEFFVYMNGPPDSSYAGGVWKVRVELPDDYPYSSPSIGFVNRIYHPNIDEVSGTVCLDVLNQSWSPMFGKIILDLFKLNGIFDIFLIIMNPFNGFVDLVNVFEVFLPQLLLDPNADDPLNAEAANLLLGDKETYEQRVKEYCERYAKPEDVGAAEAERPSDEEEVSEDSKDSGDDASTSAAAGSVDP